MAFAGNALASVETVSPRGMVMAIHKSGQRFASSGRRQFLMGAGSAAVLVAMPATAKPGPFDLVVEKLAMLVDREYPDPGLARTIAVAIRRRLRAGHYSTPDPKTLATAL